VIEISLRWQDGAIQVLIYSAVIVTFLWILSKIEIDDRGEAPIERERERGSE